MVANLHPLEAWRRREGVSRRGLHLTIRELTGGASATDAAIYRWERDGAVPQMPMIRAIYTITDGEVGPSDFGVVGFEVGRMEGHPHGFWANFARSSSAGAQPQREEA